MIIYDMMKKQLCMMNIAFYDAALKEYQLCRIYEFIDVLPCFT